MSQDDKAPLRQAYIPWNFCGGFGYLEFGQRARKQQSSCEDKDVFPAISKVGRQSQARGVRLKAPKPLQKQGHTPRSSGSGLAIKD